MAAGPDLIAVGESKAAQLLDLRPAEFRELVKAGHLPHGREIAPGMVRWIVEDLRQLASGEAADGMGDVQW